MTDEKSKVTRGTENDFQDLFNVMQKAFKAIGNISSNVIVIVFLLSIILTPFLLLDFWRPSGDGEKGSFYSFEHSGIPTADAKEVVYLQGQLMSVRPGILYVLSEKKADWIGFWVKTPEGTYDYRWFPKDTLFMTSTSPQPGDLIRISKASESGTISIVIEGHAPFDDSIKSSLMGYLQRKGLKSLPPPPS